MNKTTKTSATLAIDPVAYKNKQRTEWNKVAAGWRQWWPLFEQGAHPLSMRLIELANIQAGHQVLDVATGVGEPAVTAAQRVGPNGHVIALNQAAGMLDIARERAAALGLTQLSFREMDAETIQLDPIRFDSILCRWGLMFLPHLDETLATLYRLLKPGGTLATAVWDVPSQVPMLSLPMRVVRQMLELPPPPAGGPNPFNLADVKALEQRLANVGFVDVSSERMTLTWEFESADEFVAMTRDLAAPVTALLSRYSIDEQNAVWQEIKAAVRRYAQPNGKIVVPSETICVTGTRSV